MKTALQEIVTPLLSLRELSSLAERRRLAERYREIRAFSEELCRPLHAEDCVIQSMPDASPAKWHLAHTSWFFETFILRHGLADYQEADPHNSYLFNSYYNAVGDRMARPDLAQVGLGQRLSWPTILLDEFATDRSRIPRLRQVV